MKESNVLFDLEVFTELTRDIERLCLEQQQEQQRQQEQQEQPEQEAQEDQEHHEQQVQQDVQVQEPSDSGLRVESGDQKPVSNLLDFGFTIESRMSTLSSVEGNTVLPRKKRKYCKTGRYSKKKVSPSQPERDLDNKIRKYMKPRRQIRSQAVLISTSDDMNESKSQPLT